jgi:GT2 family glycosyltransferase
MPDNTVLLIADQHTTESKLHYYHRGSVEYNGVPFDCGLSASRNFLVDRAYSLGAKFCLLSADSIAFTSKYDLQPFIDVLEANPDVGLIGFNLTNRQAWEMNMELKADGFYMTKATEKVTLNNIEFTKCDAVKNFFLARTEVLKEIRWDNELKLCEHEDFFYRLKLANYKVLFTNKIEAQYINDKPATYSTMRGRLYTEFAYKLRKKYNLKNTGSWLKY